MTKPENMTEAHLKAVFDAMPFEMSEGELCALTLTTYTAYMDEPSEILKKPYHHDCQLCHVSRPDKRSSR